MAMTKTKWFLPLFCVVLGAAVFVAQWIGGNPRSGLISFASLAVFGGLILVGGRSETVRGLRGDGRDERFRMIDIHATAIAGVVLICTLIVVWLVELARGHDGSPYGQLMAVAGIAYLGAIAFMRWRG
jgi:drug/metabolite transporter (DMT)-like permease